MPELPEVEVSRLGISPYLEQKSVKAFNVYHRQLRWPVPEEVSSIVGQRIVSISRRAKYLLLETAQGTVILHLGMSGKLRVLPEGSPLVKHDHIEIITDDGHSLRLNDPRRFGACLFQAPGEEIELLSRLGPEPLSDDFAADHLYNHSRGKSSPVKTFIMDNHIVVGVGNIYANEALFMSGIDPRRSAGKVSKARYAKLQSAIRYVLAKAIEQGGTTLKDFSRADGQPGYFAIELKAYGRAGQPCVNCEKPLKELRIGQRSSVFCTSCQR